MNPLIITVAGIGAELTREQQPNLPVTPEEIGADAAQCEASGASIYHLHVRDGDGRPTMEVETFSAALEAIRSNSDLIVQFTSGGAVGDDESERIAPLSLQPDMASLTTGSVNFGDDVFSNPWPLIVRLYTRMRAVGVLPEFEIFEAGMIASADRLYEEHGDGHHRHYDFVLGVPGGLPAWPNSIDFLVPALPRGSTWSATGIGKSNVPVAQEAIDKGGHVRTGFEDVRWFAPGEIAKSNAQLVERVVAMASERGRAPASPSEAREILGL